MRIKRGVAANKRRKNLLKHAKGFQWRRKSHYRAAKEALLHAWSYAYRDRRKKKSDRRKLWQVKINAATRAEGMSYSKFIGGLKKANIELDRKSLAHLAQEEPRAFKAILDLVK
jgi:large subunit ribosomal protein L20